MEPWGGAGGQWNPGDKALHKPSATANKNVYFHKLTRSVWLFTCVMGSIERRGGNSFRLRLRITNYCILFLPNLTTY